MFTTRLISGIVLVILALFVVSAGGSILFGVVGMISLVGLFELYRVMKIEKTPLGFIGYGACISYYGLLWFDGQQFVTLMAIAALMLLMSFYVFTFPKYKTEEITVVFFGVFYVAVMLSYLYQVRQMADGAYLVFGKETAGLPEELLVRYPQSCVRLPMIEGARSLNLSNAVAVGVFETLRQWGFPSLQSTGNLTKYRWEDSI